MEHLDQYVGKDCPGTMIQPSHPSEPGIDSLKHHITMCRKGFPDLRFSIDDLIAERDEVVIHWTAQRERKKGSSWGIAPTRMLWLR